ERKGELAVMRAFGYRQQVIARLLLLENSLLILLGLLIGSLAALIAVAPHVLSQAGQAPWLSLGLTLLLVFATGLLASLLAVFAALRQPLLPALKAE
ncbi:MAG: FtsX-like permease family protein, partial [Calditrichaeota bacterium]|nr:FtsX-like permease family protein [Calditrichota bacterium]